MFYIAKVICRIQPGDMFYLKYDDKYIDVKSGEATLSTSKECFIAEKHKDGGVTLITNDKSIKAGQEKVQTTDKDTDDANTSMIVSSQGSGVKIENDGMCVTVDGDKLIFVECGSKKSAQTFKVEKTDSCQKTSSKSSMPSSSEVRKSAAPSSKTTSKSDSEGVAKSTATGDKSSSEKSTKSSSSSKTTSNETSSGKTTSNGSSTSKTTSSDKTTSSGKTTSSVSKATKSASSNQENPKSASSDKSDGSSSSTAAGSADGERPNSSTKNTSAAKSKDSKTVSKVSDQTPSVTTKEYLDSKKFPGIVLRTTSAIPKSEITTIKKPIYQ